MTETNDEILWRKARKRADFKKNLYSYIAVILFLWLVWWFTTGKNTGFNGYPWPVWVMLGWGIGLALQFFKAYKSDQKDLAQIEYEKLKREQEGR